MNYHGQVGKRLSGVVCLLSELPIVEFFGHAFVLLPEKKSERN